MRYLLLVMLFLLGIGFISLNAQEQTFSLQDCVNYAWDNNTNIRRANNSVKIQDAYLTQSKASRGPNLYLNANQSYSSSESYNNSEDSWTTEAGSRFSTSASSELTIYNGAKIKNTITQDKTNLEASETDIQTQKEQIGLSILSAYINVLLSNENVKNFSAQVEATEKQLEQAQARRDAGVISPSDFLNIKSQYASDKAYLVEANNALRFNQVTLMQLMNMPVNTDFDIEQPNLEAFLDGTTITDAELIFNMALGIQPSIKSGELLLTSAITNIKIAQADAKPQLSLLGSVGTSYNSNFHNQSFNDQLKNQLNPSIGLSLSIPIFQNKKVKTNVAIAQIQVNNQELALLDLKIDLRKYIEQACLDVQTAQASYDALIDQYAAEQESYKVSEEMFAQGIINSVDFITSKNNLVTAENKLTQAKYSMVLQHKIIDYYMGNSIYF